MQVKDSAFISIEKLFDPTLEFLNADKLTLLTEVSVVKQVICNQTCSDILSLICLCPT